ncbi:uncharacterized protein EV420DRAFT_1569131 [Desarmillaria tabescens]|uniref:RRM domain-containing protein n=1 Tax=Armillaria tabescens TaxID=1929756 RepID=A0AA39MUC4_ARMTA|nr:uncharacterized protein EV420DRAFT_1569131 [Desarmillaria tabescens]KAK0446957.1 hypothetical protein EV420DRAFT_1569131 [Desarmillaria tabescens]
MLRIVTRHHHRLYAVVPILSATRRTVRVEQLPDGYDVSDVVGTLRASPVEAIVPSQNYVSLRFFAKTLAKRYRLRNSDRLDVRIDEEVRTPPLSAFTVAALGRYGLSLGFVVEGLPGGMMEEEMKEMLFSGRRVVSWRLEGTRADVRVFSLHHAMLVWLTLKENPQFKDCRMTFIDEGDYLYPEWYSPPKEGSKRSVIIDNILTSQTSIAVRDWVSSFDKQVPGLGYGALRPEQNMMRLRFVSPDVARQFIAKFEDRSDGLNVRVTLGDGSSVEDGMVASPAERRSLVTAISMGACRTLVVQFDKAHHVEKSEYRAFFGQFGSIALISEQKWHDELRLSVQYEDVHDAMQAIVSLSIPGKGHMYEGARVNFLDANHLQPIFIVNSPSKSILHLEESDM